MFFKSTLSFSFYSNRVPAALAQPVPIRLPLASKISIVDAKSYRSQKRGGGGSRRLIDARNSITRDHDGAIRPRVGASGVNHRGVSQREQTDWLFRLDDDR